LARNRLRGFCISLWHLHFFWFLGTDMYIALWIRNFNFVPLELVVDGEVDLAHELASPVDHARGPCPQLKLQSILTKFNEANTWSGNGQNISYFVGGLQ
jgi:hypothetical protein